MPENLWYARSRHEDRTLLAMYWSAAHPFGTMVELPPGVPLEGDREVMGLIEVREVPGGIRVTSVRPGPAAGVDPIPLWYVLLDDSKNGVPALVVTAFTSPGVSPGTVASLGEAQEAGVSLSDRVGAVRWLVGSGAVHQIEVSPESRRQGVGMHLLGVAAALCAAHGWPALRGGAERTVEGNAFIESFPYSDNGRREEWVRSPVPVG